MEYLISKITAYIFKSFQKKIKYPPEYQKEKFEMNKERLHLFFKNSIIQLKQQLPKESHSWIDIEIKNQSIKLSTRPPILENIYFQFPLLITELSNFRKELKE